MYLYKILNKSKIILKKKKILINIFELKKLKL